MTRGFSLSEKGGTKCRSVLGNAKTHGTTTVLSEKNTSNSDNRKNKKTFKNHKNLSVSCHSQYDKIKTQ